MPVDEAPEDEEVRQSYNFAPGYHGLVYRADGPDFGGSNAGAGNENSETGEKDTDKQGTEKGDDVAVATPTGPGEDKNTKYKLQAMRWGK
jgi:hypothetical protein